ncbi:MAG: hypothetical protein ACM3L6_02250 [Deltaproteobacteria bacterium]
MDQTIPKKREEEHILDTQEMSVAIDTWDDIFSDFDPRPIEKRVLSEDFLTEIKKRFRESGAGQVTVAFMAPAALKDEEFERKVIKRLKQYFKFRSLSVLKEINDLRRRGFYFLLTGIVSLATLTLLTYYKAADTLSLELLAIILMPLGWFGIWEGFSRVIEPSPYMKRDHEVFSLLAKATIKFNYESQKA